MNHVEEVIRRNVLKLITEDMYDEADKITREYARKVYENRLKKLKKHEILELLQRISYVFKHVYSRGKISFNETYSIGSAISWIEAIKDQYRILEIGIGLGITCLTVLRSFDIEEYITIDNSSLMLAIALFKNPINECMRTLWNHKVKTLFGIPCQIIFSMRREMFDHIVCKIFTSTLNKRCTVRLFKRLVALLKDRGTMSILIERDSYLINKIHHLLSLMGMQVHIIEIPYISAMAFHAIKIFL